MDPSRLRPPSAPAVSTSGGHYTGGGTCFAGSTPPNNGPGSVKVNSPANPIVATFTWQATISTDLPPPAVIVQQDCTASWTQDTVTNDGSATGTVDCGLPGPPPTVTTDSNGKVIGVSSSGTKYSSVTSPGASFSVPAQSDGQYKPSATFSANAGTKGAASGGAKVDYQVQAFPVFVIPSGCNPAYQALTGQQIQATLSEPNGFPSGTKVTKYTWSFTGSPIEAWNENGVAADGKTPQQLFLLTDADKTATDTTGNGISVKSVNFYDQIKESVTATCTVNLTFPDGTTGSVTASSAPVTFMKPTVTKWDIHTGYVQPYGSTKWGLEPDPATNYSDGEVWQNITISVVSPFSGGSGCIAQLTTPDRETYTGTTASPTVPNNKAQGLDGSFPYGGVWTLPALGGDSDSPAIVIQGGNPNGTLTKLTANDSFTTWVMYKPPASSTGPGGIIWVPLQSYSWGWSGTVSWLNNAWTLTAGAPANAAADPKYKGTDTPTLPAWTLTH